VASAPIPVPLPALELVPPVPVPVPAAAARVAMAPTAATGGGEPADPGESGDVLPARTPARRAAPRPTRARKAEDLPAADGGHGGDQSDG
jgi:hypothetical protein